MKTHAAKENEAARSPVRAAVRKRAAGGFHASAQGIPAEQAQTPGDGPALTAQRRLQESIDNSPRQLAQAEKLAGLFGKPVQRSQEEEELQMTADPAAVQRHEIEEEEPLQGKFATVQRKGPEEEELLQGKFATVQRQGPEEEELLQGKFSPTGAPPEQEADAVSRDNRTGLPDRLKAGVEQLSNMDLSDVRVHRNSPEPARLDALAYAQGKEIHLGPGQERHLPHEAWHAVQQRQGRVKPTLQARGAAINDDAALEHEADVMGAKATQLRRAERADAPVAHARAGVAGGSNENAAVRLALPGPSGMEGAAASRDRPFQLIQIRKFHVGNWDALAGFHKGAKMLETDEIGDADQLERLIKLLKEDPKYKNKAKELGQLEERLATLRPVKATESENPVVAAIAKRYEGLPWEGEKPELEFVPAKDLVTTAQYDPDSHKIRARRDAKDEAALWDNILFEAQNARNRQAFKEAKKGAGGGSEKTLTEYGLEYAGVEYDSFKKYVSELRAILEEGRITEDKLPEQARKALAKAKEYDKMGSEEERRAAFVQAPHKPKAKGKAGLPSADLYAYEAIEGFDKNTRNSRITTVVRSIYEQIVPNKDFTKEPVKSVKETYQEAGWPPDSEKKKRPHTFDGIVRASAGKAREMKDKHRDKAELLEKLAAKLESLCLSEAAQKVAEADFK